MALDVFATQTAGIKPVDIEQTLRKSYLDYSMSVIVSRALPDARDGLKPVQRRILYAMNDLGLTAQAKFRKCAKVVGDCMGNYHPHGDGAIYDALVRLGQDFSVRYLLVDPQGNFGAITGDGAAAHRYTECRMGKIAAELLADIEKDTVDFSPNYDGSREEPNVLPSKAPLLLLNGATGIAVGMATSMAPHNLKEVCKGLIALVDNPDITIKELMKHIPGPDFPTGGLICGREGIHKAYTTGRGHVTMRARCHIETDKKGRQTIVVTEIPYMMNLKNIVEKITDAYREGKIQGISDLNDNSNKNGVRVSIELKMGEDANVILNQLYKLTPLQSTFAINNIALVRGRPETLTLKQLLECHRDHRIEVIRRRTAFLLAKAEARAHILEGLLKALDNIDRVIEIIRNAADVPEAREGLMKEFDLTEIQADAILNMPLRRLTALQRAELQAEYEELMAKIRDYRAILADRALVLDIIREDCHELIDKYGDPRRTEIVAAAEDINLEDMIAEEEMAVVVSHEGYIKRMALDVYRKQGRGGKGVAGSSNLKDGDFVEHLFIGLTKDYILFFTTSGQIHWLKVYEIPEMGRTAKGRAIANLLSLKEGERISAMIPVREFEEDRYLVMATRRGTIKKTVLSAFNRPMKGGIRAININDGDELIGVVQTKGDDELMLASRLGQACRFKETDVRAMGRAAAGVGGMNLADDDQVIGLMVVGPQCTVLTVSESGLGKRSDFADYRLTKRGAKGVINMNVTDKTGPVVACMTVLEDDEVMIITTKGMVVRTPVNGIRVIGRATQGVKVIRLKEGDTVTAVARLVSSKDERDDNGPSLDEDDDPAAAAAAEMSDDE